MTSSGGFKIGYAVRQRMNDYVGPGIYATVIWESACTDGAPHHLGLMTHTCTKCGATPTIRYENDRA